MHELSGFNVDQGILQSGSHRLVYLWDYSHDKSGVARSMVSCSNQVTVVADHSMFDHASTNNICGWLGVDCLVADELPGAALSSALHDSKVYVL